MSFSTTTNGCGLIVGETTIVNCIELDELDFFYNKKHHKIVREKEERLPYPNTYAWVFENTVKYKNPISYEHPQGAVI